MKAVLASLLLGCALVAAPAPAMAQSNSAQEAARRDLGEGRVLELRQLEAIGARALGVPRCGGRRTGGDCYEYLGPSYDAQAKAYRLIYVRGQSVIHVYVDARTGRVMRVAR
ncbi:hypothetical protein AAG607_07885 [Citromicrobium bathyomarinum]|jgi:hypothetical protein|uniref:hypothetical protein n=1 Tax=Sphingomonadales TaxID=204457 RepID=UPI0026B993E2|tara:strand:+ start:62 stop:397 length:336 start_codon:yes stop_codon:yes gene_type:complete